ncbi:TadE/TadG family type IV pilus assembly protein [Sphingomonas sp. IW22]|uniref:TadE/TadG family type IV pilus assembly protein n=1 Tax=Sphingomonas sp. IW22 TaxID=3242489 RepID=UPI0035210D90
MTRFRSIIVDRCGATLVEFALLAPILLILLLGILAYGQYILTAHTLQQLANDAARAAIVGRSQDERHALARESVAEGLSGTALAHPDAVDTDVEERGGRIHVALSVDTRELALVRSAMVRMPDPVLVRRAVAEVAELP